MSQPVNLSVPVYNKLKFFRDKRKHKSFSTAVDELIANYNSPLTAEIQIIEKFEELRVYLMTRQLLNESTEEFLNHTRAKALQYNTIKKRGIK